MKKILFIIGLISTLFANPKFVSNNQCFKSRNYPVSYNLLFKAMEQTLLNANMHIKHVSKEDGIISAEGSSQVDDEIYKNTFTITFFKRGDVTTIKTLVSYQLLENTSDNGTKATIGMITTPIPLPWDKSFKFKETKNIQNPEFFDVFYVNFDKTLFEYIMKQDKIVIEEPKVAKKDLNTTKVKVNEDVAKIKKVKVKKVENNTTKVKVNKDVVKIKKVEVKKVGNNTTKVKVNKDVVKIKKVEVKKVGNNTTKSIIKKVNK